MNRKDKKQQWVENLKLSVLQIFWYLQVPNPAHPWANLIGQPPYSTIFCCQENM